MSETINSAFKKELLFLLKNSEVLDLILKIKQKNEVYRSNGSKYRNLTNNEIEQLQRQRNLSSDWTKIKVDLNFSPAFIHSSRFEGNCYLGRQSGQAKKIAKNIFLPSGIYQSTLIDVIVEDECLIYNCGLINNYFISENCRLFQCNWISAGEKNNFGNGVKIAVGIETGGREVLSFAELDIPKAALIAKNRANKELLADYENFIRQYCEKISLDFGLFYNDCLIKNAQKINDCLFFANSIIDSVTLLENCTILSSPEEPTEISHGAIVSNSCIQWGCAITSLAIVNDSVMTEHSSAERHGKVNASIIGPNTGIGEGEVTSSLVGPFVGFHHQAMLIAAIWPEGKGNIAYGANVGSNHTSRSPDQEIFCGEGVFFGLGTNIKLPADFSCAPYTIIATGVTTLPQRIEFPFSLIMNPSEIVDELPMFVNEIVPAWVLSDNIYALRRNEAKYKKRNKARRTKFDFTIFRPDIVELMLKARDRLVKIEEIKNRYTEKEIPGLGRNFLYEYKRLRAIEAYNFYLEFYCLSGIIEQIYEKNGIKKEEYSLGEAYGKACLEHKLKLVQSEGFAKRSLKENVLRYCEILNKIAEYVSKSKAKDDKRGRSIISDYTEAHTPAEKDIFVLETIQEAEKTIKKIKELTGY